MRVGLVSEIGAARAVGVALGRGRAVVRVGAGVVVVVASHFMVGAKGSITAGGEKLLAVMVAITVAAVAAAVLRLAAADGKQPEQIGTESEGSANPDGCKEAGVDLSVSAVEFIRGFNGSNHNGGHSGGKTGSSEDENGGNASFDPRQARNSSRAVGEDADDELEAEGDNGNDEGNLGILGDGLEGLERLGDLLGQLNPDMGFSTNGLEVCSVESFGSPVEMGLFAGSLAIFDGAEAPEVDFVRIG